MAAQVLSGSASWKQVTEALPAVVLEGTAEVDVVGGSGLPVQDEER